MPGRKGSLPSTRQRMRGVVGTRFYGPICLGLRDALGLSHLLSPCRPLPYPSLGTSKIMQLMSCHLSENQLEPLILCHSSGHRFCCLADP